MMRKWRTMPVTMTFGARARQQMEQLFGAKVFLETWVRVREGWSDDEAALRAFGYHD